MPFSQPGAGCAADPAPPGQLRRGRGAWGWDTTTARAGNATVMPWAGFVLLLQPLQLQLGLLLRISCPFPVPSAGPCAEGGSVLSPGTPQSHSSLCSAGLAKAYSHFSQKMALGFTKTELLHPGYPQVCGKPHPSLP